MMKAQISLKLVVVRLISMTLSNLTNKSRTKYHLASNSSNYIKVEVKELFLRHQDRVETLMVSESKISQMPPHSLDKTNLFQAS